MKKFLLITFCLFTIATFSQSINNYEFVIVPTKFDFQRDENEYRLNTLVKYRLEEFGFKAFYNSDKLSTNFNDRCLYLNTNVVDESSLFMTKLYIEFKDCNNTVIFKSAMGSSRTKERKIAYNEAMEKALLSVKNLNYKFEGKKTENSVKVTNTEASNSIEKTQVVNENSLFAQPITNGYQLVDTTPKVVLKMFKTSQPDYYTATSDSKNGVVFKKNNEWFFEYYVNEKLVSEKLSIKF